MTGKQATSRPWYKEPWPWLLLAGPAAVVVAGIATAVIALRSDDGLVADDYYRQGLAINRLLERDRRARELDIAALARFAGRQVQVQVTGASGPLLRLRLVHPTRAGADAEAILISAGGGIYTGKWSREPSLAGNERGRLVIEDASGGWRITGIWNGRENAARLGPSG